MAELKKDGNIKAWFTMNGRHIPIMEGESKADAIKRSIKTRTKDEEDKKVADIKRNKEIADKLNNKDTKAKATTQTQSEHKKVVKELDTKAYEDGTYDVKTKKAVEYPNGYQVTFCQIGDNYSDDDYAKKVNQCLKISADGKTYAGKYEGTPEISFRAKSKESAIIYAKAHNQISIWDWNKGDVIFTGGTGERRTK